jgi:hypothetical protein
MEFVLNGNIFMSRDFGAETGVIYPGLNGNAETEIKISLYTENLQYLFTCLACLLALCKPAFREFRTVQ